MAVKSLVAISYCFAFIAVYLGSLAYAFIAKGLENTSGTLLPQSQAMNVITSNTIVSNATMGITSFTGADGWLVMGSIMLIVTILLILISSARMSAAI